MDIWNDYIYVTKIIVWLRVSFIKLLWICDLQIFSEVLTPSAQEFCSWSLTLFLFDIHKFEWNISILSTWTLQLKIYSKKRLHFIWIKYLFILNTVKKLFSNIFHIHYFTFVFSFQYKIKKYLTLKEIMPHQVLLEGFLN